MITTVRFKAVAEDLRKIGTTAVAAGLISVFVSASTVLSICATLLGAGLWVLGIYLTRED
ncbi:MULTISPECIES: hypothetical protein [Pseudomonas]|uniref:Holin n=1 Tax=Pseudomonas luteola TaxID=47886 RepID=A0ABS0MXD9_PSELU|nr:MULTISPECIES: hypothetical protein [Pseudomonas]MBH3441375.1 hypothetical protein [Pseudomonas luteola]MCG7374058.1 hypothetical protein [Pseudomonas luteola]RRW39924.1 hypothetical protein EGJ50_25260 [Pseudomonas luteola]